tara:strand:- start:1305 stop:1496 length:192 start_codon:yes stop_codon:yes gene_type:complete
MGAIKERRLELLDDLVTMMVKEKYQGKNMYKNCGIHLKDKVLDIYERVYDELEEIFINYIDEV